MSEKYEKFFEQIKEFKKKQEKQKQRGLNNYNLLTSVLSPHDEVRLHSRMIYSLLNPHGEHFQGSLFLEKFLEVLGNKEDFLNPSQSSIYKEYENIDLYITDGSKHIIIENKIWAGDQENQIKRYIKTIQKENAKLSADDIYVIYLSIDRKKPSDYSLGGLSIKEDNEDDYVFDNNKKIAKFKNINYKNEILEWLKKCQYEVQNITNLNEAIKQYVDVVKIIIDKKEDKIMKLSDYLTKDKEIFKIALEIKNALPEARNTISVEFFIDVKKMLKDKLDNSWCVEIVNDLSTKWGFPFRIYKKSWKNENNNYLLFAYEFNKYNYYDGYFGIVKYDEEIEIKEDIVNNFEKELDLLNIKCRTTKWWLHWETLPKIQNSDDFTEYVMLTTEAKKMFVNNILNIIDIFEVKSGLLTKINHYLKSKV